MLKKMFRARPIVSWEIIEKDVIDEIIFTTEQIGKIAIGVGPRQLIEMLK